QPCTLIKLRQGELQGFKTLQYKMTKHGQRKKVGESHGIKGDTETSTSKRRVRREEIQEKEGSSSLEGYNPCHSFGTLLPPLPLSWVS
ncbi:hypothetical protein LOK49_Contig702G00001, partial [Camellia lanceoleosa]